MTERRKAEGETCWTSNHRPRLGEKGNYQGARKSGHFQNASDASAMKTQDKTDVFSDQASPNATLSCSSAGNGNRDDVEVPTKENRSDENLRHYLHYLSTVVEVSGAQTMADHNQPRGSVGVTQPMGQQVFTS